MHDRKMALDSWVYGASTCVLSCPTAGTVATFLIVRLKLVII